MAYSTGTDDNTYSSPPYHESSKKAVLRYLAGALTGLGGASLRPGANFGQGLGLGFTTSYNASQRSRQAALDYAQQQAQQEIQRQNAETQRLLAERPPKPEKLEPWQLTPEEQDAIIAYKAREAKALADAKPKEAAAPKPEKPIPVQLDDGSIVYLPPAQAVGKKVPAKGGSGVSAKPPTEGQSNAAAYFDRADAADKAVAAFEKNYTKMGLAQYQQRYLPNQAQSPEQQAYNQAQREFITAKLRRESGAAISPSEFENEKKTLFAQPGDSEAVLKQKAAARRRVIEGLKRSAGPALGGGGGGGGADLIYNPATGELEPAR